MHVHTYIFTHIHVGADLEKCVEVCRGFLDGHVVVLLQNILNQRGATEGRALAVVDCITEVRQLLGSRLIKGNNILLIIYRGGHQQTPRHALYIYILLIYIDYI
jgi:small nuclear ribonucleoprotein (snRNP)-like protein